VVLTYSQTPAEKSLNLARLFVEKARNEESKMQVLITQAYGVGQFCLDSAPIHSDYWDFMETRTERETKRISRKRGDEAERD